MSSTVAQAKPASPKPRGLCRGLNDCVGIGSIVLTTRQRRHQHQHQHHHPSTKLEQQVMELEKEVQKQKELRMMYRKRMERTQENLRYCLQTAQENGFLDNIIQSQKGDEQQQPCLVSSNLVPANSSSQIPINTAGQPNFDLSILTNQAKINGWYIDHHEIQLREQIGQGSTAQIYRATWRGLDVAVKCIDPEIFRTNENGVEYFVQELDTLSRQRHRFVLQLMGACLYPPSHGWIVTEFLSTTLKEWLHGPGNRRKERVIPVPPLGERLDKALEIAQAMQYLHEQKPKVIHRDLKPSNIFLDDAMHVRVADFGHARFLADEEMALTGETGTYIYMAPEVIRCEPYNEKCDVYSYGIILNELVTGNHPYSETDYGPTRIAMEVGEGKLRPELLADDDRLNELVELIRVSWDEDASVRPSFANITPCLKRIIQSCFTET